MLIFRTDRDDVDKRRRHQSGADGRAQARDDGVGALRRHRGVVGRGPELANTSTGQGRHLGRLDHHRIARHERGREFASHHEHGKVPRTDTYRDAERDLVEIDMFVGII